VVIRDITEQAHAEEQLREKEAQYRSIFEATTDGLFINDMNGITVEVNPAACKMHGYTYEELIGQYPTIIGHPDYHHLVAEFFQTIIAGDQFQARSVNLRKDGTAFPIEIHGTTFTYKGQPHTLAMVRDISEQVQAEEQLRQKEEQYRSIFEATMDALFITDLEDGHVIEANPTACNIYGYSYEEFIGLPPSAIIHPDRLQFFLEKALPSVKAGGEWHTRGVNLRKDGTVFPVDVHETAFTYQGKPRMLAVIRDITEQVRAEQELREKEAQYRSIFEATSDGLLINDLEDGHIVEANPAECRMHGCTYEELLNLPLNTLIHTDYLPLFREYIQTVKAGGEFQARAVDLRKDGTPYPVEVRGSTFIYKGKPHALSVIRDVTEQIQAEEQLREKEEQYRSIFEATTNALLISDLYGFIVEVNPAACEMYGYAYEELVRLHAAALVHPDIQHEIEERLQTIQMGGQFLTQSVGVRKDGTPFHLEVRATPFNYKGKPHILGVVRDITEQVQAYELLEKRVEERTHELSTLLEVSHDVASTIELKPLLVLVLDQLKRVVDYTGSSFSILEGEDLVLVENRGPAPLDQVLQLHFSVKTMGIIWEMLSRREPVIIPDVQDDSLLAQAFRTWMGKRLKTPFGYIRAWLAIPLSHKEQVLGMLTVSSREPNYYTPRHASLALAIANQAAVALENARLYGQAQELAALEERQRLARELHDSVSQALYGITLGTHTARTLLERDPSRVAEPLNYVLSQAEAALTEMRALIFELRPESLETEGLVAALNRQAAALQARHEIEVSTEFCDEPDLPLKVKEELYRVAQEALHNTAKHARANKVNLRMLVDTEGVLLEVCDDGVGFDTTHSFPGHLGLHSMRERIARLSGTLQIESRPGQGTCIRAQLPTPTRRTAQLLL
jgi:PAS domain S-box-containing protein